MAETASFRCPCCGKSSHSPEDAAESYCGLCHWWTGHPELGPVHMGMPCPVREITLMHPGNGHFPPSGRLRLAYSAFMGAVIGFTVAADLHGIRWAGVGACCLGAIATICMARRVRGGRKG